MENKKDFWRSRVWIMSADDLVSLQKAINLFCEDKFVVGIQYPDAWQERYSFTAVISYKVKENGE